jgi:hypothetical protein
MEDCVVYTLPETLGQIDARVDSAHEQYQISNFPSPQEQNTELKKWQLLIYVQAT